MSCLVAASTALAPSPTSPFEELPSTKTVLPLRTVPLMPPGLEWPASKPAGFQDGAAAEISTGTCQERRGIGVSVTRHETDCRIGLDKLGSVYDLVKAFRRLGSCAHDY